MNLFINMIKKIFYFSVFLIINNYYSRTNEEGKLHYTMLPISIPNKQKILETDIFTVSYNGTCFQTELSSSIGGQIIFNNEQFTSRYYLIVTEYVNLHLDHKGYVRGYVMSEHTAQKSKFYLIDINLFNDNNNKMLYNWNITELPLQVGQIIPEKTIIVYGKPDSIQIKNFSASTKKSYPYMKKDQITTLILPTIEIVGDYRAVIQQNTNALIANTQDHSIAQQIHS
jgi:hypothetical protein